MPVFRCVSSSAGCVCVGSSSSLLGCLLLDRAEAREWSEDWNSLRRAALRYGVSTHHADDVAQEAAITILQTKSVVPRYALLRKTAWSKALAHKETIRHQQRTMDAAQSVAVGPTQSVEAEIVNNWQALMLRRAIEELKTSSPPLYLVIMARLEGLKQCEIGAQLSIPTGTAATHLFRARALLRETVRRWIAEEARPATLPPGSVRTCRAAARSAVKSAEIRVGGSLLAKFPPGHRDHTLPARASPGWSS